MDPIGLKKLEKLEARIHEMVENLKTNNLLLVHRAVSLSYYMEKAEELNILKHQLYEAQVNLESIQNRVFKHYQEIFLTWRTDVRWLNYQSYHFLKYRNKD